MVWPGRCLEPSVPVARVNLPLDEVRLAWDGCKYPGQYWDVPICPWVGSRGYIGLTQLRMFITVHTCTCVYVGLYATSRDSLWQSGTLVSTLGLDLSSGHS